MHAGNRDGSGLPMSHDGGRGVEQGLERLRRRRNGEERAREQLQLPLRRRRRRRRQRQPAAPATVHAPDRRGLRGGPLHQLRRRARRVRGGRGGPLHHHPEHVHREGTGPRRATPSRDPAHRLQGRQTAAVLLGVGLERLRPGEQPQHRAAVHAVRPARPLGQRHLLQGSIHI